MAPELPCAVDGCDRPHSSLGYCKSHADRLRRLGDPGPATFRGANRRTGDDASAEPERQCLTDGCQRRRWARGYCPTHYRRWSRGELDKPHQIRGERKPCSVDDCNDQAEARGLCRRHYQRQYYADHRPAPGSQRERGRRHILKKYDLTLEDYEALVERQKGRCAICRSDFPGRNGNPNYSWPVDHDHVTGQTRGLLCRYCNTAIAMLGDDPRTLRAAARYIQSYRQTPES